MIEASGVPVVNITSNSSDGIKSYGLGAICVAQAGFTDAPYAAATCSAFTQAVEWMSDPRKHRGRREAGC